MGERTLRALSVILGGWAVGGWAVGGWALAVVGCHGEVDVSSAPVADAQGQSVGGVKTPPKSTLWIDKEGCRPVEHVWDPASEPLRLPCAPTVEPCDGWDNDQDGITDPHCPTIACSDDAICTYGGLVADADCNRWEHGGPGCNQIDGMPFGLLPLRCQGMLCPPGLKCVEGGCISPGTALPRTPCESGADCPMDAGCIPSKPGLVATAVCRQYCQDSPCPEGFVCIQTVDAEVGVAGWLCEYRFGCAAANEQCASEISACQADASCLDAVECANRCPVPEALVVGGDDACIRACVGGKVVGLVRALAICSYTACGSIGPQ